MDIPLRVLIIEDSDRDVALEVRTLKAAGYQLTYAVADTAAEMKAALLKQAFDIVIADHDLPQFDAPGALAVLKQSGLDIPFIVVSGSIGEEIAVALMKAGAHDYVMKDRLSRLVPAIQKELQEAELRREYKRLEETRRSEQIMLARTEGIAHVGSWKWDIATDTVTWSDELFRIFQRDPREGAPSFAEHPAFYHPDDMARLRQAVEAAVADGTPYELELRAIRKDGETRVCMARGVAENGDGRAGRLFGSLQDITERKETEEWLLRERSMVDRIMKTSPAGIIVVNRDGRIIFANKRAEEIYGLATGEMTGRSYNSPEWRITDFDGNPFPIEKLPRAMVISSGSPVYGIRHAIHSPDGRCVYLSINGAPIHDENGNGNEVVFTINDVTEQRSAEEQLQQTLDSLRKAVGTTIQVMVSAVETRDPSTAGHQIRSADLARAIATEMGLTPEKIEGIHMAGSIHDIGKLSIPAEILSKSTKLSDIEFAFIKEHAKRGFDILKSVESSWPLAEIVHQHHERMDGSGYPRNLKGEEICIEARILAVADVVEAMSSHRPYRPGLSIDAALNEIEQNSGTLYDKTVAAVCLRLFREKGFILVGT